MKVVTNECGACLKNDVPVSERFVCSTKFLEISNQKCIDIVQFLFPDLKCILDWEYKLCEKCNKLLETAFEFKNLVLKNQKDVFKVDNALIHELPTLQEKEGSPNFNFISVRSEVNINKVFFDENISVDNIKLPKIEENIKVLPLPTKRLRKPKIFYGKFQRNAKVFEKPEQTEQKQCDDSNNVSENSDKPFSCKFCKASFVQKSTLRAHEGFHISKRPYSCKKCPKKYVQLSHLRYHERSHNIKVSTAFSSPIKLFKYYCEPCKKSFKTIKGIKIHRRKMHTDLVNMEFCKKVISDEHSYHRHYSEMFGMSNYY